MKTRALSVAAAVVLSVALGACSRRAASPPEVAVAAQCDSTALAADSASLSFVDVEIGSTVRGKVSVSNNGASALEVGFELTGRDAAAFDIGGNRSIAIGPGGDAIVNVAFRPSRSGSHEAALRYAYSCDGRESASEVRLLGEAVDVPVLLPAIDVSPATIAFDHVAGLRVPMRATLVVGNVGSEMLRLGVRDEAGDWVSSAPEVVGDLDGELELEAPSSAVLDAGLAPNAAIALQLTLWPKNDGDLAATIRIRSDDPDRPIIDVPVKVTTRVAPCPLEISTESLAFDATVGNTSGVVTLRNAASDPRSVCVVTGFEFARRAGDFSTTFIAPASIESGMSVSVTVKYRPSGSGAITSALTLHLADGSERTIAISAWALPGCPGGVAPRQIDFGTIGSGCGSPVRQVLTLYSACNGPITVDTVRVTGTAAALLTASLMPEAPLDVPKGGAFQVGFQYDARLAYGQSAQLEIDVAGFEGPLRVIPLVLQKPLPPIQTDVFAATGQLTFSLSHPVALDEPEPVVVTIDGQPFPKFDAQGMERWTYSAAQNTVTFAALAAPNAGAIVAISYKSTCP